MRGKNNEGLTSGVCEISIILKVVCVCVCVCKSIVRIVGAKLIIPCQF